VAFSHLRISDARERWLVGLADLGLAVASAPTRLVRRSTPAPIRRALLLRLERIGDLLMTVEALAALRAAAPTARLDLVVGRWNADLARMLPHVDSVETLDAPWLAREDGGDRWSTLIARALAWRRRKYDLAVNFEGDVRSNLLMGVSGARRRVGFDMAGGGPMLTDRVVHDPEAHTSDNALRLVARACRLSVDDLPPASGGAALRPPAEAVASVEARLAGAPHPLIALHSTRARPVKQWGPEKLGDVGARLVASHGATIVLMGAEGDRSDMARVAARLPADARVVDLVGGLDLAGLAAALGRVDLTVAGDSAPMHLADAMRTPVVAVFGPSDPVRYAPRRTRTRIVRIDLPCSPCNRIRRPPERCVGREPDCLRGIDATRVYQEAVALLDSAASLPGQVL
jgi:ADP-heptose:LPS heptosyltransferase